MMNMHPEHDADTTADEPWVIDLIQEHLSATESPTATAEQLVITGRTAAAMTVVASEVTHFLAEQLVQTVEHLASNLLANDFRLPETTACQIDSVLQVAIEDAFSADVFGDEEGEPGG